MSGRHFCLEPFDDRFIYLANSWHASPTPDSLKALYLISWRYIISDFYRVEFDNYTFHHVPVIERTLARFTTLARGLEPPDRISTARTSKASQGRKPKLKSPCELCAPVFTGVGAWVGLELGWGWSLGWSWSLGVGAWVGDLGGSG